MQMRRSFYFLLLLPLFAGCFATQHIPLDGSTRLDEATGVTTRSGDQIEFSATGATMRNDTLHANGIREFVAIPADSVAQISVRKFSATNTAGLAIGVGLVAFLGLALIALGSFGSNIN
jgi:hypothetical protein